MFKLEKIVLELLEYFNLVGMAVPFYPWDQKIITVRKISHAENAGPVRA